MFEDFTVAKIQNDKNYKHRVLTRAGERGFSKIGFWTSHDTITLTNIFLSRLQRKPLHNNPEYYFSFAASGGVRSP